MLAILQGFVVEVKGLVCALKFSMCTTRTISRWSDHVHGADDRNAYSQINSEATVDTQSTSAANIGEAV